MTAGCLGNRPSAYRVFLVARLRLTSAVTATPTVDGADTLVTATPTIDRASTLATAATTVDWAPTLTTAAASSGASAVNATTVFTGAFPTITTAAAIYAASGIRTGGIATATLTGFASARFSEGATAVFITSLASLLTARPVLGDVTGAFVMRVTDGMIVVNLG